MIRSILMDNALGSGLIYGADSMQVSFFRDFVIAGLKRVVETAEGGLHSRLNHAIAQVLLLGNLNSLHSGLDVCQNIHPLFSNSNEAILAQRYAQCKLFLMKIVPFSSIFLAEFFIVAVSRGKCLDRSASASYIFRHSFFNRKALLTTVTEEKLMASAHIIGERKGPPNRRNRPAAKDIPMQL